MAQVTGGGGKAAVMPDFDPKGTTLRDTIIGYAKASRAEGNKLVGFEDKLFRNKAVKNNKIMLDIKSTMLASFWLRYHNIIIVLCQVDL